jgi:hypothetical protein
MTDDNNDDLENMLDAEAAAAQTPLPIEASIGKLSSVQFAALKDIVLKEGDKRSGGADYANMDEATFRATMTRLMK